MKKIGQFPKGANLGTMRVYFYDVDTGEEILGLSGAPWMGVSESAIVNGARFEETCLSVDLADGHDLVRVTCEDFPGRRVAVKMWYTHGEIEWRLLVDPSKGWRGNEACWPHGRDAAPVNFPRRHVTRSTFGRAPIG